MRFGHQFILMEIMKIGIHSTSGSYSDRWLAFCQTNKIEYKLVDCLRNDIVEQLEECDALMWHFNHKSPKYSKFAKQLLFSLESSGKPVFPDFNTVWHFDDKVGQKYLLEAIDAPLANAYVFYSRNEALEWVNGTVFPKVFKLRNGAGSENVRLARSAREARHLINKSFRRGFRQYNALDSLRERIRLYRLGKTTFSDVTRGVVRLVWTTEYSRLGGREQGYVYFQDFIPDNKFDIRVVVIGNKAFAIKRLVRENDFRASGSGTILYEKSHFDEATIKLAFETSDKLSAQCMAYDFVYHDGSPLIVEISYGFAPYGYDPCTGYWDRSMNWHEGSFNPYGWMIEDLVESITKKRR